MPKPITELKNEKLFAVFAGEPGCGKSTAGASFRAPGKKVCVCDFDLRAMGIKAGISEGFLTDPQNILVEQFPPKKGYQPFESFLEMQLDAYKRTGAYNYDTLQVSSLFAFSRMLKVTSHSLQAGKTVGKLLRMDGPADFNFEITATHQFFDFFRMLGCNFILDAHLINKWGKFAFDEEGKPIDMFGKELDKEGVAALQYAENHIVGEQINVRPAYASTVLAYFDNVFRFGKEQTRQGKLVYSVEFASQFAKNSFGIKPGAHDITGKNFYDYFTKLTGWGQ